MKEIINYVVVGLLSAYAIKKKFFDSKKTEYETMQKALEVWKEFTGELTNRVEGLTAEIADLRVENQMLKKEIRNLETILKQNNYGS
jgi:predicted RNase H-like nuclease (RuvC/YqgF family)